MSPDTRTALDEAIADARIAELKRQLDAANSELQSLRDYDPNTLARFGLYTGAAMVAHAAKVREHERGRYTPEEQAAANAREKAKDAADLAEFQARRTREHATP